MKTVRFSALVDSAGHPDTHLLFMKPEADKVLQKAIKSSRVVTVFQNAVGNQTDHGEVGFKEGPSRQYLIFPRSVRAFAARRVVGIKYDLLESAPIPKSKQAAKPVPPVRKKSTKVKAQEKPGKESKESHEAVPPEKVVKFLQPEASPPTAEDDEESEAIEELKAQVRKAMDELEKGKQVAAFNLLKRIVGD